MPLYTDQLNRCLDIVHPPKRIISVVPSQTELLHYLKLDEEVIAITKFCVHPAEWFRTKPRIGGTKQLHLDNIRCLNPDLILANKEENRKEEIELLTEQFPVWVSDVNDLSSAYAMIKEVGKITGRENKAGELISEIQLAFATHARVDSNLKPKAAYLIWKDPYMTVGGDTFIDQMLGYAGFENIFSKEKRYPQTDINELKTRHCEVLLLSSEPYPFRQKHIDEFKAVLPNTKILLADGELFSWYGSRLLQAPSYFKKLYLEATA
jgi:ABC-type Fe3+-hydroxamate transport system substrate-binding protein